MSGSEAGGEWIETMGVCGRDIGDAKVCRCLLPAGHNGLCRCRHDAEAAQEGPNAAQEGTSEATGVDLGSESRADGDEALSVQKRDDGEWAPEDVANLVADWSPNARRHGLRWETSPTQVLVEGELTMARRLVGPWVAVGGEGA